jgi:hypothetical protein
VCRHHSDVNELRHSTLLLQQCYNSLSLHYEVSHIRSHYFFLQYWNFGGQNLAAVEFIESLDLLLHLFHISLQAYLLTTETVDTKWLTNTLVSESENFILLTLKAYI